ncbi:MAG: patatin-like phospholipase family protein [Alphaproteobacteria bacterium]|nr:patatin-like phospholipase family protein [Alphaproteobacteria bacterium]
MARASAPAVPAPAAPARKRRMILVLQGGGALGSYQAGVVEALTEAGYSPDWVAGVSIGAINAALVAGNPPERRVERMREFWRRITAPSAHWPRVPLQAWERAEQKMGAASAVLFGQPGFFRPRLPFEWLGDPAPTSYYDTSELRTTLLALADFDRINGAATRLSVGAVHVETGNMTYFDSHATRVAPEHVMASGALPPALTTVNIDGADYWDGGLISNTPLQYVMDQPRHDSLIFQIDLFPARGPAPLTLDDVNERVKDIRFSSRTRTGTEAVRREQNQRRLIAHLLERLPQELHDDPIVGRLRAFACPTQIDVVHLIYHPRQPQGPEKDFQFDRGTMERRWQEGLEDARQTLAAAPWTVPAPADAGLRTFDVLTPRPNI